MLPERFTGLFLATPAYGGVVTKGYHLSTMMLVTQCNKLDVRCEIPLAPDDSLVTRARNTLAAVFLASSCSHIMFIDADIQYRWQDVFRLIQHDKDVCCGIYPKKQMIPEFPLNWLEGSKDSINQCKITGCIEIKEAPTGFMMIHRSVFEKIIDRYPEWKYKGSHRLTPEQELFLYAYFQSQVVEERLLSEDFYLSYIWRQLGGQVWFDPEINLKHYGQHGFDHSIQAILKLADEDKW